MNKRKSILTISVLLILVIIISFFYKFFLDNLYDSRNNSDIFIEIDELEEEKYSNLDNDSVVRYTVYDNYETVLVNSNTGAFLDSKMAKNFSFDDIEELRRINNEEFIYENEFRNNKTASKGKYILVKTIKDNEVILKAYISYDPTIGQFTDFWYNGKILTSKKSLHTFDVFTGEGISSEKTMQSVLLEEEIRKIND